MHMFDILSKCDVKRTSETFKQNIYCVIDKCNYTNMSILES